MRYIKKFNENLDYPTNYDLYNHGDVPIEHRDKIFPSLYKVVYQKRESLSKEDIKSFIDKYGIDADNNLLLRVCCRLGRTDLCKFLVENGAPYKGVKILPILWAMERGKIDTINYFVSIGLNYNFERCSYWMAHTRALPVEKRNETIKYLQELVDSGKASVSNNSNLVEEYEKNKKTIDKK